MLPVRGQGDAASRLARPGIDELLESKAPCGGRVRHLGMPATKGLRITEAFEHSQ